MLVKWLWVVSAALILGLQFRLWVGEGSFAQAYAIQQEIEAQKQKNAQLRERNARLQAEVMDLKTAEGAIEERARNQLGMIYPNEKFFWLADSTR